MKAKLAIIILQCYLMSTYAQTVTDIEKKYGQPQEIYSVSKHIWMTPEYANDGQVCRMRLYPKRVDGNTSYVGAALQYNEVRDLLNSLVPPSERGMKLRLNFGATATGGPATWTTYPYERITFTFTSSFLPRRFEESPPLRKGEYTFAVPETESDRGAKSEMPSTDDFLPSQSSIIEIVTIRWNDRKCRP
jgi:hypothetical protein